MCIVCIVCIVVCIVCIGVTSDRDTARKRWRLYAVSGSYNINMWFRVTRYNGISMNIHTCIPTRFNISFAALCERGG